MDRESERQVAWKREQIAHNGVRSDDVVEVREARRATESPIG